MKILKPLSAVLLACLLSACSDSNEVRGMLAAADSARVGVAEMKVSDAQREKSRYLAYTHHLSIDLPVDEVAEKYKRILAWCAQDSEFKCTLLKSGLTTGNYIHATVAVRILPKGVNEILGIASEGGSTKHKSTEVEDLGEAIVDNQKRQEMLRSYRERLEALEKKPNNDVESLVKIASELSQVQSDLEYAEGKRSKLLQRVEMDIVNISISSQSRKSFSQPIGAALKSFKSRLSEGISDTITAIAYLLPWLLLVAALLFCARKIWVRVRRK